MGGVRTARVFTNLRCNQACGYCTFRKPEDDLLAIQPGAVRAEIAAAVARGAGEVVLTGGEPTLRSDLAGLVRHAKSLGVTVVLETNATVVEAESAARLRDAGLDRAVVNLSGATAALDGVTLDPGGFERSLRGVHALAAAGVYIELQAAVVRSTKEGLVALVSLVRSLEASALVLVVPNESPEACELLCWEEACEAVLAVEREGRRVGLPIRLSPDAAPPPCAFPRGARFEHLFGSLTKRAPINGDRGPNRRDGYRHLAACASCVVEGACPGVAEAYLARHPAPSMNPVADERRRRRLSLVTSVAEQTSRELVSRSRLVDRRLGSVVTESIIRIQFHCNQSCAFCFVSTHLPPPADEVVRAAILDAADTGTRVVLSGGEPTLNPRLPEYVRLAKSRSKHPVTVQTNAVELVDGDLVDALVRAGLDEAFVSLHGASAEVSDRVTDAPGTFARTVRGIDRLVAAGITAILNFVLCEPNYREATRFVELVASRWPMASVNFSFVAPSSDLVPRTPELIPRYRDVLPHLEGAMRVARARGVLVVGLESMCGLPLCLVPGSIADLALADIPAGFDEGEFVKTDACRACSLERRCYGLRRGYAAMYGSAELVSVREAW